MSKYKFYPNSASKSHCKDINKVILHKNPTTTKSKIKEFVLQFLKVREVIPVKNIKSKFCFTWFKKPLFNSLRNLYSTKFRKLFLALLD